ncbi:MAG TPA: hypothetical protein VJM12_20450 [Pyrinomonadaceae bacterium]|nr:hypothetical protein [Pyrinomonadaceae bacterium]
MSKKGLTTRTEVSLAGSPTVLKKWTTISWTQDDLSLTYQKNPRPTGINVYDEPGNRRRTTIEYHSSFGLPWFVVEYAADTTTVFRRTRIDYRMTQSISTAGSSACLCDAQFTTAVGTCWRRLNLATLGFRRR